MTRKKSSRLLLVEEPRPALIIPALVARAFGTQVRFARPCHRGTSPGMKWFCRLIGISHVTSSDMAPNYDYYGYFTKISQAVDEVVNPAGAFISSSARRLELGENAESSIRICLWNQVKDAMTGFCELSWIGSHVTTWKHVSLLPSPQPLLPTVFRNPGWGRVSPLYHVAALISGTARSVALLRRIGSRVMDNFRLAAPATATATATVHEPSADEPAETDSNARAVYFLHHGLEFGNLYEADYVLSPDPVHPLHRDNIVFYCYFPHDMAQPHRRKLNHRRQSSILGLLRTTLRLARAGGPQFSLFGFRLAAALIRIEENIRVCRDNLATVPTLELAIVGYDIMCPPEFITAAQSRGIRCVAVQERSNTLGAGFFPLLLDDYFVAGSDAENWIANRPNMRVARTHRVGPVRASWLTRCKPEETLSKPVRKVAVFDSKSLPWHDASDLVSIISWENNRMFLDSILKLAEKHPSVSFTIRGKNVEWRDIPYFASTVAAIDRLTNIRVEDDYSKPRVSYQLVEECDLCICRYTSLGEEALASGKPVIFFEGTANGDVWIRGHCDYGDLPIYAPDVPKLERMFEKAVAGCHEFSVPEFRAFINRAFSANIPGTPQDRIFAHLNRFLAIPEEKAVAAGSA